MNKEYNCALELTLHMIGGKYKSLILYYLINKTLRFNELSRLIPDATQKMLIQQLRDLVENNIVIRTVFPVVPPKVEYSLSDLGKTLIPVLQVMSDWGKEYVKKSLI